MWIYRKTQSIDYNSSEPTMARREAEKNVGSEMAMRQSWREAETLVENVKLELGMYETQTLIIL